MKFDRLAATPRKPGAEKAVKRQNNVLKPLAHSHNRYRQMNQTPSTFHTYPTQVSISNTLQLDIPHQEKLTLPRPRKKEPNNKNLQRSHTHHKRTLNNAEPKYAALSTAHSTEIAVLARSEVFLVARYRGELA